MAERAIDRETDETLAKARAALSIAKWSGVKDSTPLVEGMAWRNRDGAKDWLTWGDFREVIANLAKRAAEAETRALAAEARIKALTEALKEAEDFISDNHENLTTGDGDTFDAEMTLKLIRAALSPAPEDTRHD